ncbi:Transferase [Edwardsiella anguillarum]|uniref:glycosyltransferase n=1 Tax=Edwardsiella TaxID=635 RepID=UPI00045CFBBF|nr:glycosyltransferase [Edwardsiella anguillarum]AKM48130.1 hypothetical protein QY76_13070 [Edwardsiella sp. EA181011]GAJ68273.1 PF09318 domain protein [Edwardsiella piscicida]RFT03954.1 hypothetical protein CGL57_09485 [Edwardsiella anguillarum]BET80598.1 Transferase [Edwardsiella anguillarum]BET83887.1 Transferase [Edwardsiella anguillarum]
MQCQQEYIGREIVMLYPRIGAKKNGLVMAMLKRANTLGKAGCSVTILTVEYDSDLLLIYQDLLARNLIHPRVRFVNMYAYYLGMPFTPHKQQIDPPPVTRYLAPDASGNFVFDNVKGEKRYEVTRDNGVLAYVNYLRNGQVILRAKYDGHQCLSCVQSLVDGKVLVEYYFKRDGKLKIINSYDAKKEGKVLTSCLLFTDDGFIENTFTSEKDLFLYFFDKLFLRTDYFYHFIIDRAIYFGEILLSRVKKINHAYYAAIHAAHYVRADDINSRPNKNYVFYFENVKEVDAFVFLTRRQLLDAQARFVLGEKCHHIPHVADNLIREKAIERKKYKCISLGRFDPVKRLPELVKIFSYVVQAIPEAMLEIYGYGSESEKIMQAIETYGLQNSVKLCAYTEEVSAIYQSADLMLFTSSSEGWGLVIMEALANACPVIAFDINYGPADMIRDGENGFLIEDKQYRVFAEKVIAALRDRDGIQLLQDNAIRSAKEYTEFNFSQRWMTLLSQIELAKGCQLRLF